MLEQITNPFHRIDMTLNHELRRGELRAHLRVATGVLGRAIIPFRSDPEYREEGDVFVFSTPIEQSGELQWVGILCVNNHVRAFSIQQKDTANDITMQRQALEHTLRTAARDSYPHDDHLPRLWLNETNRHMGEWAPLSDMTPSLLDALQKSVDAAYPGGLNTTRQSVLDALKQQIQVEDMPSIDIARMPLQEYHGPDCFGASGDEALFGF